ncbi:MAG: proton-conducting transporter membrane subunit [Tepidisphaeraceae bacterium]
MAGPTPVSALIHAATMVAAGVFLLIRIDPILTADARLFVTVIGAITIAVGSLCAVAQRDLKQALAYSTMAQLGYMVLGVGVGSRDGAGFHLVTHAFFKALLFLAAGVVIHGMHHKSRLEHFGGLFRRMPITAITFAIGALAMSAVPFFSGYYSKEVLLAHAASWVSLAHDDGRSGLWSLVLWVPVIAAYITPFYLTRLWMLTFAGKPRDVHAFEHAGEPGLLSFPLALLSGLAIVSGYSWFPVKSMVEVSANETQIVTAAVAKDVNALAHVWPMPSESNGDADPDTQPAESSTPEGRVEAGMATAATLTHWAWLVGLVAGVAVYARGFAVTERLAKFAVVRWPREWLRHRMYFDDLYRWVVVGSVRIIGKAIDWIDRRVIDGVLNGVARLYAAAGLLTAIIDDQVVDGAVRGISATVRGGGGAVGWTQGGRIRVYVASAVVMIALVGGGLTAWAVFG